MVTYAFTLNQNVIGCKWAFRLKKNLDGSIQRHKAHLVAKGFTQRPSLDSSDAFSPIVKAIAISIILALAVHYNQPLRQVDINNVFLYGDLTRSVFMQQPLDFDNATTLTYVYKLNSILYGLKQALRVQFIKFTSILTILGFKAFKSDSSLMIMPLKAT